MSLVLVAIHLEPGPRAVPLGPAMLASALRRHFGEALAIQVLDLFLDDDPEACADRILASAPQYVGFSMYVWNRPLTLAIARILKARQPGLVVFVGGSEATADLEGVQAEPAMSFVLPGEGEELIVTAMTLLAQGVAPEALQARVRPAPVKDLATLSSPFLDGTLDPARYSGQLWELSRGCPFTCDFCFESRGGSGTRRVPMDRVQAELELFEAAGVAQVFVLDPTFNYNRKMAKEILRLIQGTAPGIHFFFEIRSEFLDRELARLFASIRCTLQIGLQSSRVDVLRNIGRTMDPEDFQAKILLLHEAGATYGFDLIYGLPGDSLDGFRASLDFALALAPNHLDLFRLSVLPGTRLRETAAGFGLEHQFHDPYQVLASPTFSPGDLARAERLARGCDLFYNQGKAVPWFAIVQSALEEPPSVFFEGFADYLEAHPGDEARTLQVGYLAQRFRDGAYRPGMDTVAADLVTYFGQAAELAEPPAGPPRPDRPSLSPRARLARFHHDPQALLEQLQAGITELEDLSYVLPAAPCEVLLHAQDGTTAIRPLSGAEGEALRGLGERPSLAPALGALLAEGLLIPSSS